MKLVYFGSGAFGLPTLEALSREHELLAIVTQPDKPSGRQLRLTPTPVGEWSAANAPGVPLHKPASVNEPGVRDPLRALGADAWVVIAFGQKLGRSLLEGVFAVNLHASLLPRWRGAAPINHAIVAGDAETGNSVITLADRMDAGLVHGQSRRPIGPSQTAGELHDLLASDGPALVLDVLARRVTGALAPREQDEALVTLAPKLSRDDAWVDFSESAFRCARRINGLSPWPGVTGAFRGEPLKLLRAEPAGGSGEQSGVPGAVLHPDTGLVACASGQPLRLLEVQPPGKRAMAWADFARGQRVQAGEVVSGEGAVLTLWDLLPKRLRQRVAPPVVRKPPTPRRPARSAAADRYDALTKHMLAEHRVRVRRWRTSMTGVAWEVHYEDGQITRLIEAPRPKGPMSAAIFLHEIGHHAIGFTRYKPRCLEEYHAWAWAIRAMEEHGVSVTDAVRRRMHESLHYAVAKAARRGLRLLPQELVPFVETPARRPRRTR